MIQFVRVINEVIKFVVRINKWLLFNRSDILAHPYKYVVLSIQCRQLLFNYCFREIPQTIMSRILQLALVVLIGVSSCASTDAANLTAITWKHDVNTHNRFDKALNSKLTKPIREENSKFSFR